MKAALITATEAMTPSRGDIDIPNSVATTCFSSASASVNP